jgi:cytochrome b subunit of formate dehydrogenase
MNTKRIAMTAFHAWGGLWAVLAVAGLIEGALSKRSTRKTHKSWAHASRISRAADRRQRMSA